MEEKVKPESFKVQISLCGEVYQNYIRKGLLHENMDLREWKAPSFPSVNNTFHWIGFILEEDRDEIERRQSEKWAFGGYCINDFGGYGIDEEMDEISSNSVVVSKEWVSYPTDDGEGNESFLILNVSAEQYSFQEIKRIKERANYGEIKSQYILGKCYYYGNGVECDIEESKEWLKKAAEQGHSDAQYRLGKISSSASLGVIEEGEGFVWFEKAAKQGHPLAQLTLGTIYLHGMIVEQDLCKAKSWLQKSVEEVYPDSPYYDVGCLFLAYWAEDEDMQKEAIKLLEKAINLRNWKAEDKMVVLLERQQQSGDTKDV